MRRHAAHPGVRHAVAVGAAALVLLAVTAAVGVAQEPARAPRVGNPHGDIQLDCKLCHSEQGWDVGDAAGDFDHDATGFPLEGRHADAACRDCHREPVFAHVATACVDCHQDVHRGSLGPDCASCHSPTGWIDRTEQQRAHDATRLPLVGAHARVDCDACHAGALRGDYVGTPVECAACHLADFEATQDPDHRAAGFATDCQRCHGTFSATWGSGDFIHSPNFPLTGAHARAACIECHAERFAGTPTDCYACHRPDYDATTDPGHLAANFPTQCAACHSTSAWEPAEFDHDATGFALTGAHRQVDCLACHSTGYSGTPTDCYACHRADYDATSDPNHAAASFPTTCATCHSTTAWEPASWDHETFFPIASGRHSGFSCTECHVVPTNYAAFECILCHEHNQNDTDPRHNEVNNYVYASSACYECHPRGRGE